MIEHLDSLRSGAVLVLWGVAAAAVTLVLTRDRDAAKFVFAVMFGGWGLFIIAITVLSVATDFILTAGR